MITKPWAPMALADSNGFEDSDLRPLERSPEAPERTCLGCRARKGQGDLMRLALDLTELRPRVVWDPDRRLGGRGAWLCRGRAECLNLAIKKRALLRAFRLQAEPDLTEIKAGLVVDEKK